MSHSIGVCWDPLVSSAHTTIYISLLYPTFVSKRHFCFRTFAQYTNGTSPRKGWGSVRDTWKDLDEKGL